MYTENMNTRKYQTLSRLTRLTLAFVLLLFNLSLERTLATYTNNPPPQPGFTHPPIPGTDDRGYGIRLSGNVVRDSSPLLCDLQGDGRKEIVVGGIDGMIYAYRSNGTLLWSYNAGTAVFSSPACGDLNGDGRMAVVVGLGDKGNPGVGDGGVIALEGATGALRWRFSTMQDLVKVVYSSPALGDLDGDGKLEVVFGSWDRRIYALDSAGKMLWQYHALDSVWSSPAIADLDNDGHPEVIIGADITANVQIGTPDGGYLYVFNRDGTIRWRAYQDQTIFSSPAIGDINGDGHLDIVVGTGNYLPGKGFKVYAYDRNGNLLPGWPVSTGGYVFSSPALADLNGDGKPDVAVIAEDGKLYAWNGLGQRLWTPVSPVNLFGGAPSPFTSSPIAADVGSCAFTGATNRARGSPSLLFGVTSEVGVVNSDGVQITDNPTNNGAPPCNYTIWAEISVLQNSVAVGDIDNDGVLELVAASGNRYDPGRGYLYVWKLSNASGAKLPWPQFRQNAQRTGVYPKANFASIDDAAVFSNTIPSVLPLNYTTTATIAFRNTGSTTWTPETVNLVPVTGDPLATVSSYSLPSSVAPGGIVTFTIQLRTPNSNAYAITNWRLNRIGGSNFGAAASRKVKVGNQPAFYVLRGDGQIYNGGLATPLTPRGTWPFDAARQLALFYNGAGGYVFDLYGPWHFAPAPGMTYGPNEDLALIGTGYVSVGTESLREVDLFGSTFWQMSINGNFYAVGGQAPIAGLPPAPGGGQAISFALTPNRDGVYMLLRDGSIRRSTAATIVPNTPTFPGQDRFRKIKVTTDGLGYYVMDKFGQVYNGGAALAIASPSGFPASTEVAVDFELTADGRGYYLLTRDGVVHAAGTAAPISTNPTPTWTVDVNRGMVARDLVLADSRIYMSPVLQVTPSSISVIHNYGSGTNPTFTLSIANTGGSGSIHWTATPPTNVTLSATSGTVSSSTLITGTVAAGGYAPGTYSLGSIVFTGTSGGQAVAGTPQNVPITLRVGTFYNLYLPLVLK